MQRKAEYLELVRRLFGTVPDAAPMQLYRACLAIVAEYDPIEVQSHYHGIIKPLTPIHSGSRIRVKVNDAIRCVTGSLRRTYKRNFVTSWRG